MGACECVSKAACVLGHWRSVKGCGASWFAGCSTSPSRRLDWKGRGFGTGNSAARLPGSSAGNTARPQTHGSTNTQDREGDGETGCHKKIVKFTAFIFMYMASYILTFSASLPRSITQKV